MYPHRISAVEDIIRKSADKPIPPNTKIRRYLDHRRRRVSRSHLLYISRIYKMECEHGGYEQIAYEVRAFILRFIDLQNRYPDRHQ